MQSNRTTLIIIFLGCALLTVAQQSPYISHVWEYSPAPGQFVNELPAYAEGDDAEAMRLKVQNAIADNAGHAVTLGGWGGYLVFGFDHMVPNIQSQNDLLIQGNAFYADVAHPEQGGSSEPGVVFVSYDANNNGLPDDTWYELAGSEYGSSVHDYRITYFLPDTDHVRTPAPAQNLIDTTYIAWRDLQGKSGYIAQNRYHLQPYFPQWMSADRMVFTGTLLPDNAVAYQEQNTTKYIMMNYAYGYADNHPNDATAAELDIQWAVNKQGQPANLPGIHFVKVQTGTNSQCGWIGEISTEVTGAVDLHALYGTGDASPVVSVQARKVIRDGQLLIMHGGRTYTVIGVSR